MISQFVSRAKIAEFPLQLKIHGRLWYVTASMLLQRLFQPAGNAVL